MRIIPPSTKMRPAIIRGITVLDAVTAVLFIVLTVLVLLTSVPIVLRIVLAVICFIIGVMSLMRYGVGAEKDGGYIWLNYIRGYLTDRKKFSKDFIEDILPHFIDEEILELDDGAVFAAVIHLTDINLSLQSTTKQESTINAFSEIIKSVHNAALCKVEIPLDFSGYYERYLQLKDTITNEYARAKAGNITQKQIVAFENRLNVVENWIRIFAAACNDSEHKYRGAEQYLIIYENKKESLDETTRTVMQGLDGIGLMPRRIGGDELSEFLNYYTNKTDGVFDYPNIRQTARSLYINDEEYEVAAVCDYPYFVENCWASPLFSIPDTTVICRFEMVSDNDAKIGLNKAIKELRYRYMDEQQAVGQSELVNKHDALRMIINQIDVENEKLLNCTLFVQYKKADFIKVRDVFRREGFYLSRLAFRQFDGFIASSPLCVKYIKTFSRFGRLIQSKSLAASFPITNMKYMDEDGDYIGDYYYPIMWNLWNIGGDGGRRQNANLFVHGTAGGGKSRTLKQKSTYEIVRGRSMYIFDIENEYIKQASEFDGKVIEMSGGATVINPLQIFTLDSAHAGAESDEVVSVESTEKLIANQVSFLSEWFKIMLEDVDIETRFVLSTLITEMYRRKGTFDVEDLRTLEADDYPTFDDLLDTISDKIIETAKSKSNNTEYDITQLRTIRNLIKPFTSGEVYAPMWNGATTIDLVNNSLIIFNFQTIFAEGNTRVCNAQMMLVMRLIMQTIIKQREYNIAHKESPRHSIVLVDEAHRYVDKKFAIALDTLEQFARRLRKYGSSLWIATQSIGDFLGATAELKSKAEAIIDNCNYQIILGQKGSAIENTIDIYRRSNPLTQAEVSFVTDAQRGQGLIVFSQNKRTPIRINVLKDELQYIE